LYSIAMLATRGKWDANDLGRLVRILGIYTVLAGVVTVILLNA